ncbi:hypothetical protein TRFO_18932 [Tritrichomonas foetus]|uniref:Amino acid transporter transmembrane domain-containing protein n=1 Tax=Tritrichomonas foetus TaxID=1144522 RepID=A0A1J4KK31_9EUKA|nr:hypothetical protein TRFO_18932 [Tritrichomonas foetus]|eukprot:OHT11571.1 hypothetical protein TRFO_18932 [Tritrichomonas foetus]
MQLTSRNKNPIDIPITKETKRSSSILSITLILAGGFTCTGCLKISNVYKCGIIIAVIVNFLLALITYYTMILGIMVMKEAKHFSAEQIWATMSPKTRFIPALSIFIPSFGFVFWYYGSVVSLVQNLLKMIFGNVNRYLNDHIIICMIIFVVACSGYLLKQDLSYITIITYIKFFTLLVMACFEIIILTQEGVSHEMTYVSVSPSNLLNCVMQHVSAYSGLMLFYTYIWQMSSFTYRRARRSCYMTIAIVFTLLQVFGIVGYLILGNTQTGVIIDQFPPDSWITKSLYALFIILVSVSIPVLFQPAHRALLNYVITTRWFPKDVWSLSALVLMLIEIVIPMLTGQAINVAYFLMDFFCGTLCFILPAALYLTIIHDKTWYHITGCILLIIIGVSYSIFMILRYFVLDI